MSPVHVIVGEDQRAEAMWAGAFTGAVDLYRFDRNVDAFERLTAAEAPIDLVVLTPAQRGPFNLTADQFIARVLEGPLGASRCLANLHVIVVGQTLTRSHPRVMSVTTLDAAIRLVKFGEIEHAPRPEAPLLPDAHAPVQSSSHDAMASVLADMPFSGSVISRIWDAPDPEREERVEVRAPRQEVQRPEQAPQPAPDVMGGGPVPTTQPATGLAGPNEPVHVPAQLFARTAPGGFMVPPANVPGQHTAPVMGGGDVAPIGTPNESIEVATGALQPARQYQLQQAGYRGPAIRGGNVHGAAHDGGGQPVPPALASQVQTMVYGGMHVGNPNDPLLTWSSGGRDQASMVPGLAPGTQAQQAPAPMQHAPAQVQHAPAQMQHAPMQHAPIAQPQQLPAHAQPAAPRVVPMEPPAGVYSPAPAPVSADPFLARAEQGGGDVAFG